MRTGLVNRFVGENGYLLQVRDIVVGANGILEHGANGSLKGGVNGYNWLVRGLVWREWD